MNDVNEMDRITTLYEHYKDILEEFGEQAIRARFQDLCEAYECFIKDRKVEGSVRLNRFVLTGAVLDYFVDISRLKPFHQIRRPNTYKVLSHEISWLLRRKPLQILEDGREDLTYINEKFVLSYVMSQLAILAQDDFYEHLDERNKQVMDGYIESLYYHLKYRNCDPQTLELALLSFGAGVAAKNGHA